MSEWTDYMAQVAALNNGDNGIGRLNQNSYEGAAANAAYWGESPPPTDWQPADPNSSTYFSEGAAPNQPWLDVYNEVKLPGQEGLWRWDPTFNQYQQPEGGNWNLNGITNVNVVHDDGTGSQDGQGVYNGQVQFDNTPTGFDKFIDVAMPAAVMAITALAGGAAIGGAMGVGEGAAAGAAVGEGASAGSAAGIGEAGAAAGGAAETVPVWSYGIEQPSWATWSQAGGTELGTGLYGTDPGSMAGLFGTTAGGSEGMVGSALGSGLVADAAAPYALAGAADIGAGAAGAGFGLKDAYDIYKYGNNALKLYNAVTGQPTAAAVPSDGPTGALSGGGGMVGSAGLAQALAAAAGVKGRVPGEADYTDMTSEIGQIPMVQLQQQAMQATNNTLPKGKDDGMLNGPGLGKFPYL